MNRINRKEDEEGAMGVGTLIVFIAMVLVAAVAASVLIDTANKLQQQAQKTGDQAIQEVSTAFTVKEVNGNTSTEGGDGDIDNITLVLGLAAGSPAQNLSQVIIEIDNGDIAPVTLEYSDTALENINSNVFNVTSMIDPDNSFDLQSNDPIMSQGTTVKVRIPIANLSDSFTVETQDQVTMKIIPKHGTPTLETFYAPPVFNNKLVELSYGDIMRRIKREEDEEGAMGVGTLIVFIAMVLVAAVAASVLINTANKLQQQAQKTGDQAIQEVSTAFTVKDVVLKDDGDDGSYDQIILRYKLAAGSPEQNLSNTMITVSNGNKSYSVEGDSTSTVNIYDESGSGTSGDILAHGYMAENTLDVDSNGLDPMSTQEDMNIKIIPKHGTPTLVKFSTPPVMTDQFIEVS